MKVQYTNNLKHAFLVLENEESSEEDFQIWMLRENEISGLLKMNVKYLDNRSRYYYEISGKKSLKNMHEKSKMSSKQMKKVIEDLLSTIREIQKYMLEGTRILLDPEFIFCENQRYFFCYYPSKDQSLSEEFHKLTEFFVREVDYDDQEGVQLAYTLHKSTMEEYYSVEKIMNEIIVEREKEPEIHYDEIIEERLEENAYVAEKDEMWEPVKRLLERKKRGKWGSWDEIHVEEDDL